MDAARLDRSVVFLQPTEVDDGYGGVEVTFADAFSCRAHFTYLRHGEAIQSMRLAGRQTIAVKIRRNATSLGMTQAWRMREVRTGFVFNVTGIETSEEDRRYLEVLVVGGEVAE